MLVSIGVSKAQVSVDPWFGMEVNDRSRGINCVWSSRFLSTAARLFSSSAVKNKIKYFIDIENEFIYFFMLRS